LLLSFLDESGCQVTLKVTASLVSDLAQRFAAPPDQA